MKTKPSLKSVILSTAKTVIQLPKENEIRKFIFDNLNVVSPLGNFLSLGIFSFLTPLYKKEEKRLKKIRYYADDLNLPEGITSGGNVEVNVLRLPLYSNPSQESIYEYLLEEEAIELGHVGLVSTLIKAPTLLENRDSFCPGEKQLFVVENSLVDAITTMQTWKETVDKVAGDPEKVINFIYFKKVA